MSARCVRPITSRRVDAEPRPESLRVWGNRVYKGKLYAEFFNECVKQLAEQQENSPPLEGPLLLAVEVICTRPKTTKRSWPVGDCDNFVKGPMDALTQTNAWGDDDQVQAPFPCQCWSYWSCG